MKLSTGMILVVLFFTRNGLAQQKNYPQNYFRHPLNIPMQLVANFGEIRTNHWHMGLDIRTQHRVNLPVFAAAEGYISRVSVEPGGFGQAIYIEHPNGFTTLYGHLNSFFPALAQWVKQQQYDQESWKIDLALPPALFPVKKGDFIALSGSTGASEGPHVHFEIRNTQTENCLNPLLFRLPIADAVPPTLSRLALYDRNRSTYEQKPQILALKKTGAGYSIAGNQLRVGSNRISFAIGATDRFSGSANPNGIYSAAISMDGETLSSFILDDISYNDTRYINAQLDYPYKARGGGSLQHLTPLPGAGDVVYHVNVDEGIIYLEDSEPHDIQITVSDAAGNTSTIRFRVQYDAGLAKDYPAPEGERLIPDNLNIFEKNRFELFTTEKTIYDTVAVTFNTSGSDMPGSSSLYSFLSGAIPVHDTVTVRIRPSEGAAMQKTDKIVIRNMCGEKTFVARAAWQNEWITAKFRQFGTFQAFVDKEPPAVNAPPSDLSRATRIVFTPRDNFEAIRSFRAELDDRWLRFSNDKGRSWVYTFDEKFPRGDHELKVTVEDEAGNLTTRTWHVRR